MTCFRGPIACVVLLSALPLAAASRRDGLARMGAQDQEVVWEMASLWPMKWVKTVPYLGTSGRSADSIYLYAHPQNLPPCCDVPIVLDETADLVWNVSQTTDMPQSIVLVTSTGGPFGDTTKFDPERGFGGTWKFANATAIALAQSSDADADGGGDGAGGASAGLLEVMRTRQSTVLALVLGPLVVLLLMGWSGAQERRTTGSDVQSLDQVSQVCPMSSAP